MSSDNDPVELIAHNTAGPSKPFHKANSRRRRAPAPRRKAQLPPPQDVIEIQDSDEDDEVILPVTHGKGKNKAVESWINQVEVPAVPQQAPLFFPDDDSGMLNLEARRTVVTQALLPPNSDADVQAILDAVDEPVPAVDRPQSQQSHKGKETVKGLKAGHSSPQVEKAASPAPRAMPSQPQEPAMQSDAPERVATQVLEIVPDVDREHLHKLIKLQASLYNVDDEEELEKTGMEDGRVLQAVLHVLLENPNYPKTSTHRDGPREPGHPAPVAGSSGGSAQVNASRSNSVQFLYATHKPSRKSKPEQDVYEVVDVDSNINSTPRSATGGGASGPPPARSSELESDPVSRTLAQVLEIVPDVEPTYVTKLIHQQLSAREADKTREAVAQQTYTIKRYKLCCTSYSRMRITRKYQRRESEQTTTKGRAHKQRLES